MAKLQKQLRIHLQRLPDHVLQASALCLPLQTPQCVDRCIAETNPPPLTQPDLSGPSCPVSISTAEPSQPKTLTAVPHEITPKNLVLRLHRLPLSKLLPPSVADPSVQHPPELWLNKAFKANGNKTPPQTDGLATQSQEEVQEEQEEVHSGGTQHEEEKPDSSEEETVLPSCQTSDPDCVLRSQTPAECASVNTLTGLSNGFNQKGLLQNKLKIRVDFKVSL